MPSTLVASFCEHWATLLTIESVIDWCNNQFSIHLVGRNYVSDIKIDEKAILCLELYRNFIFTTKKKKKQSLTFCVLHFMHIGFEIIQLIIILFYDFAIFKLMLMVCKPLASSMANIQFIDVKFMMMCPHQDLDQNKIELTRSECRTNSCVLIKYNFNQVLLVQHFDVFFL